MGYRPINRGFAQRDRMRGFERFDQEKADKRAAISREQHIALVAAARLELAEHARAVRAIYDRLKATESSDELVVLDITARDLALRAENLTVAREIESPRKPLWPKASA